MRIWMPKFSKEQAELPYRHVYCGPFHIGLIIVSDDGQCSLTGPFATNTDVWGDIAQKEYGSLNDAFDAIVKQYGRVNSWGWPCS